MATISATEFVEKVSDDPNFRSQIGIAPSMQLDDFREKAAAAGYNYTNEELYAAAEAHGGGALSDEALENVTGGAFPIKIKGSITISIG